MADRIQMPQGMAYGWWHFPIDHLDDLGFDINIVAGAEQTPARYLQLYQGHIGDAGIYFGFQTDVARPGLGGQGLGLIFSRWGTRNESDAAPAENGWIENSGHEGDFVGVRSPFEWSLGKYHCRLHPSAFEANAVWYEFTVEREHDGATCSAGSLRFTGDGRTVPKIKSGGGSWTEVYRGAQTTENVPFTQLDIVRIRANNGQIAPQRCDTTYNDKFPLADASCTGLGCLSLRSGRDVTRIHAPSSTHLSAN